MTRLPTTVAGVIDRLRAIDDALDPDDGAAVFNRVYLHVTERVGELLAQGGSFQDDAFLADLDVRFANLWLAAYDAAAAGRKPVRAWRPLFEARSRRLLPIQFALAGMNAHIEHDLPLAVVRTCEKRGMRLAQCRRDYLAVNRLLAAAESDVRRSFLDDLGRAVDDEIGPAMHLVSSWNIERARDVAWTTAETLWALRGSFLLGPFREGIGHTVGMGSRVLLTPLA